MTSRKKLKKLEWHLAERISRIDRDRVWFREHGDAATARGVENFQIAYREVQGFLEEMK